VQVPIPLMIRNGLHALTRKFVGALVSSLATVLIMAIFPYLTKPTPPVAPDAGRLSSIEAGPVEEESNDALADFMERVALSHVAALRVPPAAASEPANGAASETRAAAVTPSPLRQATAPRHDRTSSSKVHTTASIPKVPQPAAPPPATIEPAAAASPVKDEAIPPVVESAPVKAEPLPPLQFGMHLVSSLGDTISASEKRVVESVASVGDTLTSFAKKL
jgi:hypothetical protein